jgi:hypothetical protein
MRNDARPIGERSPASPVGGTEQPIARERRSIPGEQSDSRESVTHHRESHVVNPDAERNEPSEPGDPVMPSSDSSVIH